MPSGYIYSWVSGSVNFNTPKSWYNTTAGASATAVPGPNDEALVSAGGSIHGPGGVFDLALTGTGSGLTVGGTLVGSYVYVGGTLALSTGSELYSPNLIDIGDDSGNTLAGRVATTLTVDTGAILFGSLATANSFDILVGQYGGSGTLAVNGGEAASGPDGYWVGNEGTGLISVTNGGIAFGGFGSGVAAQQIGLALGIEGGAGTLSVSGPSSSAEFGDIVEVGFGGAGSIAVSSGGFLDAGNGVTSLNVGDTYAGTKGLGTVSISGGTADLNGLIDDGANGYGHINLSNGATVTAVGGASSTGSFSVLLGGSVGSSGTLSLASQSIMKTQYGLAVGSQGVGELDVSSGAELAIYAQPGPAAVAIEAGVAAGAIGYVNVSGGTIIDTASAGIVIGGAGTGTLTVTQAGSQGGIVLTGDPTSGTGLAVGVSAGSSGLVSVSGSASGIGVYGGISDGSGGSGTIVVGSGARLQAGDSYTGTGLEVGGSGGTGSILVGTAAQVLVYGQTDIGQYGTGSLSVIGGSSFTDLATGNPALVVGVSAGATGTALISDASTYVPLVGGLVVGSSGNGSLAVQNSAEVVVSGISGPTTPGVVLGAASGSRGTLSIASEAVLTTSNGVAIGSDGAGELDVSSATLVVNAVPASGTSALDAGIAAGASGVINVAGGTINDTLSAGTVLGASGTGTLNITQVGSQGGLVLTGDPTGNAGLALGVNTGSSGVVVVSGANSGLGVYGTVTDGSAGTGAITLSNGARFVAGDAAGNTGLVLGGAGGVGSVLVSGGAQASVLGQTEVGQYGSGTLAVIGGSSFTGDASGFPALLVGVSSTGTGSVSISDPSTYVDLTGGLVVGSQGTGSLTVQSSALLNVVGSSADNVPGVVVADHTDSAGTLSVTSQAEMLASFGIVVGSFGDGVLNVASGTVVSSVSASAGLAALDAGVEAGSSGTVDVTGGLIEDTASAGMIIGQLGSGTLTIAQSGSTGGTVLTGNQESFGLAVGQDTGASGTVSVSGSASGLGVYGAISDGGAGTGTIGLTAGARLSAGAGAGDQSLLIGGSGGSGVLSLAGGAFASVLGEVLVGAGGTGVLSVSGGAGMIVTASTSDALAVGSNASGTGSVVVSDAGSYISLGSGLDVGAAGSVTVQSAGLLAVTGATVDVGSIKANGGSISFIGGISGAGSLSIASGGQVSVGGSAHDSTNVAFGSGGGTLAAASTADLTGTITGWSSGDFISLTNTVAATESFANGTLSLFGTNSALIGTLHFGGTLTSSDFTLTQVGSGTVIGYHT